MNLKDNNEIIQSKDIKDLEVKKNHLEVIKNLPSGFVRVDFNNPESILYYGHDDKEAISNILVNTAKLSIKQGNKVLSDEMIKKIYSFDEELDESDKKANKKELAIVSKIKSGLSSLGIKKFDKEKEQNSYGAKYELYYDNIQDVCNYMEEQMQESLNDINLRRQIAFEMKPYLEHLQMTIKAGEADYFLLLEEIENMKNSDNSDELVNEIREKELVTHVFNDKLDKLKKVFVAYRQQLLVYAEQQHNEMILVKQQQSYIEDQQAILRSQGSSMIFNRQQSKRASELEKLNEATNKAYQQSAAAIIKNTDAVLELAVNGNSSFAGDSLEKSIEYIINGYPYGFNNFLVASERMQIATMDISDNRSLKRSLYGGIPLAPLIAAEVPDCMLKYERNNNSIIRNMFFSLSYSALTEKSEILNRGLNTLYIIDALEKQGDVINFIARETSVCSDEIVNIEILLKKPTDMLLDLKKYYYPMAGREFLRRILFRVLESIPVKNSWDFSYGRTLKEKELRYLFNLKDTDLIISTPIEIGIEGNNIYEDTATLISYLNLNDQFDVKKIKKLIR